jgi:anti-sigma B factor antagonist
MRKSGPVIVMELPEQLNHAQAKAFLRELRPLLDAEQPRLVLDCSKVRLIDSAGIAMMLHCMQEAMKRDGDMKLAAVSPASAAVLELMRVDRLFESFDTEKEAVQSFDLFQAFAFPMLEPRNDVAYGTWKDLEAAS